MGDAPRELSAPKKASFRNGLVPDTLALDATRLTGTLRSYMDQRDQDSHNDPAEIARIRDTILERLKKENLDSKIDADREAALHSAFTIKNMVPIINKMKKSRLEANKARKDFNLAKARLGGNDTTEARTELTQMIGDTHRNWLAGLDDMKEQKRQAALSRASQAGQPQAGVQNAQAVPQGGVQAGVQAGVQSAQAVPQAGVQPAQAGVQPDHASLQGAQNGLAPGDQGQGSGALNQPPAAGPGGQGGGALNQPPAAGPGGQGQGQGQAAQGTQAPPPVSGPETEQNASERFDEMTELGGMLKQVDTYGEPLKGVKKLLAERKKRSAEEHFNRQEAKANADISKYTQELTSCAERWDNERKKYRESTFKRHYDAYDSIASTYYKLTREQGENGTRAITGDAGKRIAEYTGVYNADRFSAIGPLLKKDPYVSMSLPLKHYRDLTADSLNEMEGDGYVKLHKAMVLKAFSDGVSTLAEQQERNEADLRMKVLGNFRGYQAKKQFVSRTGSALMDKGLSAGARRKILPGIPGGGMSTGEMNLTLDEKGRTGGYLTSENNARLQTAVLQGGRRVTGLFDQGILYSDTGETVEGQKDLESRGKFDEMDKKEKIRQAIRRSDYFRHINAGTIQEYLSYNPDDDFSAQDSERALAALDPAVIQQAAAASQQGGSPQQVAAAAQNAQAANPARSSLPAPAPSYNAYSAIRAYIAGGRANQGNQANPQGQNAPNPPDINEVRRLVLASSQDASENVRHLGVVLLSSNDPELWNIARELALNTSGKWGEGRIKHRLKHIPQAGQVMRTALLEEFSKDRSFSLKKLFKNPSSMGPDIFNMHLEDLAAKRAKFFSLTHFRQALASGLIYKKTAEANSAVSSSAHSLTDAFGGSYSQSRGEFAENFAALAENVESVPGLVTFGAVPLIVTSGMFEEKGTPSEGANTTLVSFKVVQDFMEFVNKCREVYEAVKSDPGDDRERSEKIQNILVTMLKALYALATMVRDACKAAGAVNDAVEGGFGLVENGIALIDDTIKLVRSLLERKAVDAKKGTLNTALTAFKNSRPGAALNETEQEGESVAANTQAMRFLKFERDRAEKDKREAITDMTVQGVDAVINVVGLAGAPIAYAFKPAEKLISFISWCVEKRIDNSNFKENIGEMLGDKAYAGYSGFDEALNDETGIKNQHYLLDLSKVFMAIDTHCLVHKGGKNAGESKLAIDLMQPFLKIPSNADESVLQGIKLSRVMDAVGIPGNWRAVLRSSITG